MFARSAQLAVGAALLMPRRGFAQPENPVPRKMKLCLTPGSIGVDADQVEAIRLAAAHAWL
jgi:hypothetical protein